jgi:hypothetical protein
MNKINLTEQDKKILLYGILGLLIFLLVTNKLKDLLNFFKSQDDTSEKKQETKAEIEKDIKEKEKILKPTFSDSIYLQRANLIHDSLKYSTIDDKPDTAENAIINTIFNDLDFLKLAQAYGVRQLYIFGIPDGSARDLTATVTKEFSSKRLERVNETLRKRGVTISF